MLSPIHGRMPTILPPEAFDLWLDCDHVDARTAEALIRPAPEGLLESYEISTAVNRTANDDARLLQPVMANTQPAAEAAMSAAPKPAARVNRAKKDSGQGALF